MPGYRNIGGSWRAGNWWRRVGGTWKSGTMWRNIGGIWKAVGGSITATAAPASVVGTTNTNVGTTSATTATPGDGIGPYSYAWEYVSGDSLTINSSSSASTTFTAAGLTTSGDQRQGVFRCVVTDTATNQTATTNNVTATVTRN